MAGTLARTFKDVETDDYGFELKKGKTGTYSSVEKFGAFDAVPTSTEITLWDGGNVYTYLAAATKLKISSDNAVDNAAGTGARTVEINGLDGDYVPVKDIISLNGQTEVETVNEYLRAFRKKVLTAGTGEKAAGNIYSGTGVVTGGVPANIYTKINASGLDILINQTLMAIFTIPAGWTGYIDYIQTGSESTRDVRCSIIARSFGSVFQLKDLWFTKGNSRTRVYRKPLRFEEKTDIEIRAINIDVSQTVAVSAAFDITLVKNNNNVPDLPW